ncbi:MAG: alpha-L-fucosidase [Dehalococcoidia bacterium]
MPDIDAETSRPLPQWFDDAKFGIMVHWGPSSVPGFAPRSGRVWDVPDHFKENPYAEWYRNSLKIEGSSTRAYHERVYGVDTPYERFGDAFKVASATWDADEWASLFARAGARYVVPIAKHHDGFLLWPSRHQNPHAPAGYFSTRDLMGEFAAAARAKGIRFGLYYSGGIDWLWHDQLVRSMADLGAAIPRDPEYAAYAFAHWRELVERYQPDVLWNDIYMPGTREALADLFAEYYAAHPDGVINDRWKVRGGPHGMESMAPHDFTTPEYETASTIRAKKFECVRGIGYSFGYNRDEGDDDYQKPRDLIHALIDIVSKGGNLLLNAGPMADGTIPALQRQRLEALGAWLASSGGGIYGTRPWLRAEGVEGDGRPVRFTAKDGRVYAHVLDDLRPGGEAVLRELRLAEGAEVTVLGSPGPLEWRQLAGGVAVAVRLPAGAEQAHAYTLALPESGVTTAG